MTVFDYAVIGIIGVSIFVSILRGFLREVMALLAWVAAFWVASLFTDTLAPTLPASIPSPELRLLAAFALLFFVTWLLMTLIAIALSQFLKVIGVKPLDRALGAVFGLARGIIMVLVLVLLAGLTRFPKQPLWKNAMLSSPLEAVVLQARPWLPKELTKRLNYD